MENKQDIFSKIPKESAGLALAAFGVIMLIGAIRRWKWVLDITGQRSKPFAFLVLMHDWFGEAGVRVGIILLSIIIIICGVVLFVLM